VLVRLRVDHSRFCRRDGFGALRLSEAINPQRFGAQFVDKVANLEMTWYIRIWCLNHYA
jgi:hypothetical protein